jgi:hypothetical protein
MALTLMLYDVAGVSDSSGHWCLLLAALVLVTLDNGEGARVLVVLHHEPKYHVSFIFGKCWSQGSYSPAMALLVFAVDLARLLEFGDELADGLGVLLSIEVHD